MGVCFRRCAKHVPYTNVIRAILLRLECQFCIEGGHSYDLILAEKFSGCHSGNILLAQMNPVRIHRHGDINPVINDKWYLIGVCHFFYTLGDLQKFSASTVFFPQLDNRRSSLYGKLHRLFNRIRSHKISVRTEI